MLIRPLWALLAMSLLVVACTSQTALKLGAGSPMQSRRLTLPPALNSQTVGWVESGLAAGFSTPTVVFIHGSPGSWAAWKRYMDLPALTSRARLVAVDRPGFGTSGRGQMEPSLKKQAAAVAEVLKQAPHGPVVLAGHSYGGPVACRLAVDRPDLRGSLFLIAPSVDPKLEEVRWYNRLARSLGPLLPRDLRTSNREILALRPELEELRGRLAEITMPTRVLQGARDRLVPAANAEFLKRQLNSSVTLRILPQAGHMIPWQHPEPMLEELLLALDQAAEHSSTCNQG